MPLAIYETGTITVAANGTTVTGIGTAWSSVVKRGSILQAGTGIGIVTSDPEVSGDLPTDTSIKLKRPWTGGALTSQPYALLIPVEGAPFAEAFIDLMQRLAGQGTSSVAVGVPSNAEGRDGDVRNDPTADVIYFKSGGAWQAYEASAIVTKTASYALVLADRNNTVEMNLAGANTLTVPPNSTVAFPINTKVDIVQLGAGQTTITPGTGVTIRSEGAKLKTAAQYARVSLQKRATNEWLLSGNRAA